MFSWNTFPYSDFNKVNLDWICRQISACGTFWTCSNASLVIDPDRGTGVSFYLTDMTGPAGDAEPKQGDAVFYSLDSITYCAFIDDVVGAGGGNPEFLSWRIYRMTGPQGEPGSGGGTGLTEEIKQALLQLAEKVAYIDANGADYYQDLYDALYDIEPPATLVSIEAVYTQRGTVYDTDTLDSLKTDIVVTATYSDTSTAVIPAADYTLSGSLTVGTSTITVSYGGQTDTFTVTVTENPAPPVTLVSIDAVYTQSATVYDTDTLDSLKTDLVVTATYSDSSTAVIPAADYTLSGSLTVGISTITVSYDGQTDTFTVTVTENANPLLYNWDFTQSLTDTVGGITATTNPTNTPIVQDSGGLHMTAPWQFVNCGAIFDYNRTYEVDVANYDPQPTTNHMRFIMWGSSFGSNNPSTGPLIYRNGTGWTMYQSSWSSSIYGSLSDRDSLGENFTVRITVASDGTTSMYLNGVLQGVSTVAASGTPGTTLVGFGSNAAAASGGQFYNADITAFRVYSGVIN